MMYRLTTARESGEGRRRKRERKGALAKREKNDEKYNRFVT
jgi:hypothetical protein